MYVNLPNVKSPYNFLSSTVKMNDYFNFIKEQNLTVAFQIDTNNFFNTLDFYFEALRNNIKPVIGVELEFITFNLICIPNNNDDYRSLMQIFYFYETKKDEMKVLQKIDTNFLGTVIIRPKAPDWKKQLQFQRHFYYGVDVRNDVWRDEEFKDICVFVEPINLLNATENEYLKIMTAIKENKKIYDDFAFRSCHYLNDDQLRQYIDFDVHLRNIKKIIDDVQPNVIVPSHPKIIDFDIKDGQKPKEFLRAKCQNALQLKISSGLISQEQIDTYKNRLDLELATITQMGFESYFLVVADFVNFAKENDILVGPGRGSAAGSLVSYLLNITEIDPINYKLLFERFLNPKRVSMPDIDIDFQDDRRQEVLEYLAHKYQTSFAQISTFQTIGVKNALRDCAKILDISEEEINDALKSLEGTIEQFSPELFAKHPKLRSLKGNNPLLFKYADFLTGLPRQFGTHAAGIVLSSWPLETYAPVFNGNGELLQMQYSAKYLEKIGLIKIDILGLRNLSVIKEVQKQIEKSRDKKIELSSITLNDAETFNLLSDGDTNAIFQFESRGMIETLKKVHPNSITDLGSVMALFRPGPLEFIPDFVKRKNSLKWKSGFGFEVDEILKETYGVIIYQEQIMKILQIYAGFDLYKADTVRAAISKKNEAVLKSFKQEFIQGALKMEHNEKETLELWANIEKFASYGFNKSHAIAYSIISYWMAYLKCHFRAEFYSAILNGAIKDKAKVAQVLYDFKKKGGKIVSPSIRNLISKYHVINGAIVMPLTAINGISSAFVDKVKEKIKNKHDVLKDKANPFGVMALIHNELVTKDILDNLFKSGVFDWYQIARKQLLQYDVEILRWLEMINLTNDFSEFNPDFFTVQLKDSELELETFEKQVLGFSVNSNVIGTLRSQNAQVNTIQIAKIAQDFSGINIVGRIVNQSSHTDKNGEEMVFLDFADETGEISVTVFASTYKEVKKFLTVNNFYIFNVKTQMNSGQMRAILNKIIKANIEI